jgi:lipopolysaccharide transport system ATP-binding protein
MMTIKGNIQMPVIELVNVSKLYHTYPTPRHKLLELISGGRKQYSRETHALDKVSFSLQKGARLGVVGENGSGKSTLLKVLAGVLTPTSGNVKVRGRVSALLELGAGFNPELPGQENIRQFCMLHGMHRDEIDEALPDIIKFSELRDAINQPVKTYSSGMGVRLGFACAVYVQPDILIVDEALSVGDAYFQNKCLHKIRAMLDQGTSFIYVTHAADSIRSLCNEALWLEKGKIRLAGSASEVGSAYQSEVFRRMVGAGLSDNSSASEQIETSLAQDQPRLLIDHERHKAFKDRVEPLRTGSGEARVQDILLLGLDGADTDSVEFNSKCRVQVFFRVEGMLQKKTSLNLGVTDSNGRQVLHFSSAAQGVFISPNSSHGLQVIEFEFDNQLCPGEYGFVAGIGSFFKNPQNNGQYLIDEITDYCAGGMRFKVRFPDNDSNLDLWGVFHAPYSVSKFALD